MAYYKRLSNLVNKIEQDLFEVLKTDIFEAVRDVEKEEIDEIVYNSYEPREYERRYEDDGLISDDNIVFEVVDNNLISVNNETQANLVYGGQNKDLVQLIIGGHGSNGNFYDYPRLNRAYMQPRDFIQATKDNLNENNQHIKATKTGLKKRKYNIY